MSKKILLLFLLIGCGRVVAPAQQIAIKTNTLYWLTATPNLGVEVALSKHSTLSVSANYNPWTIGPDNKIQHWFIQPEYRYWFSEKFTRCYVGVHFIGGEFEVGGFTLPYGFMGRMQNNYYVGSAIGLGLSVGYNFYLSPHWSLEAMLGVGVLRVRHHTEPVNGPAPTSYQSRVHYIPSPTEAGISFVYLFNSPK